MPPVRSSPRPLPYALALLLCAAAAWMPAAYFRTRAWEADGRVYRALGVRAFRSLVPDGDVVNRRRRRRDPRFRVVAHRRGAAAFVARTVESERSHAVLLLAGIVTSAYAWQSAGGGGPSTWALGTWSSTCIPMLLQRYTRARLHRLLARPRGGGGMPLRADGDHRIVTEECSARGRAETIGRPRFFYDFIL